MKANIPGFKEGVYMSTDSLLTDVRPINVQKQLHNGKHVACGV